MLESFYQTYKRFPLATLSFLATGICSNFETNSFWDLKITFALLALSLLSVIRTLYVEACPIKNYLSSNLAFLGLGILTSYYCWKTPPQYALFGHFGLFFLGCSLPFFKKGDEPLWCFSYQLMGAIIYSILYIGLFYLGMGIIVGSISYLFDIRLYWLNNILSHVFHTTCFTIIPLFLLKGIPLDLSNTWNEIRTVHLEKFLKYVVLPFVCLYAIILCTYGIKIIYTHVWPKGRVTLMVACLGSVIMTMRFFGARYKLPLKNIIQWILCVLVVGLMLPALFIRLSNYGFTEMRYIFVLIAVWLLICTFLESVKWIPFLAGSFLFIAGFSPFNAYSISKISQSIRLKHILQTNGILKDGTIYSGYLKRNTAAANQIHESIKYLVLTHKIDAIKDILKNNPDAFVHKNPSPFKGTYSTILAIEKDFGIIDDDRPKKSIPLPQSHLFL